MFSVSKLQILKINYVNCSFPVVWGNIICEVDIFRIEDAYEFCPKLTLLVAEQSCSKFRSVVPRRQPNPRAIYKLTPSEATRKLFGNLCQVGRTVVTRVTSLVPVGTRKGCAECTYLVVNLTAGELEACFVSFN
jgi:hypothetical protein